MRRRNFGSTGRGSTEKKLEQLAKDCGISEVETIKSGQTLELGTVVALLAELKERLQLEDDTLLIDPASAHAWASHGLEGASSVEELAFAARVR